MADKKPLKRGAYQKKECPYCGKMTGNLGNHVKMAHPTALADAPAPQPLTKEELIQEQIPGTNPKADIQGKFNEELSRAYACANCKAELRKGETKCWNCQQTLIWEGIE